MCGDSSFFYPLTYSNNFNVKIIGGDFSATYYKSSNRMLFKVGDTSGALTLQNLSVTSDTVFNINGDSYQLSGTKLQKK